MGAALRMEPSRLWPEPEPRTLDNWDTYPILSYRPGARAQMMTSTPDSDFERTAKSREAPESRARHIMSVVVLAGGWRWRYSLYARPNPPLRQCLRRRCRNASALRSAVFIYTRAQDEGVVELHIPDTPDSVTEAASEFAAAVSVSRLHVVSYCRRWHSHPLRLCCRVCVESKHIGSWSRTLQSASSQSGVNNTHTRRRR